MCFNANVRTSFAFGAELVAVIYAIEVAKVCFLDFIWLESESMHVVSLLHDRSPEVPWRMKARCCRILDYIDHINFRATLEFYISTGKIIL